MLDKYSPQIDSFMEGEKMKKILTIMGVIAALVVAVGFGSYQFLDNARTYEENDKASAVQSAAPDKESPYDSAEEEYKEQTKYIGGEAAYTIEFAGPPTEAHIINVMHKMTHQKVKAEEKWGAIPLNEGTVKQIIQYIESSDFGLKDELMVIAKRWEKGDFSTIIEDHNYFWKYEGGTIGRAYGTLNAAEEAEFIKNNFE